MMPINYYFSSTKNEITTSEFAMPPQKNEKPMCAT